MVGVFFGRESEWKDTERGEESQFEKLVQQDFSGGTEGVDVKGVGSYGRRTVVVR